MMPDYEQQSLFRPPAGGPRRSCNGCGEGGGRYQLQDRGHTRPHRAGSFGRCPTNASGLTAGETLRSAAGILKRARKHQSGKYSQLVAAAVEQHVWPLVYWSFPAYLGAASPAVRVSACQEELKPLTVFGESVISYPDGFRAANEGTLPAVCGVPV